MNYELWLLISLVDNSLFVIQTNMLQPIGDKVLVRPLSKEEVTKSGIVLPETAKEKPQEGEVMAVGRGKIINNQLISFEELGIKVGDKVVFSKYSPNEVTIDDEELYIISVDDIYGVIK